ncbi:MAG: D-amino acid aminotransferase [Gemmatimonadota bacterium]|nr:D-amino acid aminotransferase [Gemmatimonadota bacterium]MDH3421870.1 D-amino acid aminotransferase [Gemmatimonadota bacterium]
MSTVYLNGAFVPKADAKVSVDDRGFLLGDGVYEVAPFYQGVPLCMDRHLARLERSLAGLRIDYDIAGLEVVLQKLIEVNELESADRALVYLQITRGVAPRTHYFPEGPVEPTVYAFAKAWSRPPEDAWSRGFTAITVPDRRWMRVDIKSICLLPNGLAYQDAREAGVDDAILVRDGVAIEGTHQNFWGVIGGTVVTHPESNLVLSGITRGVVLEVACDLGIPVQERAIQVEELRDAEELFFTGTTAEVRPCVEVDGRQVGKGGAGPVTRRLSDGFLARVAQTREAAAAATP